MDDFVFTQFEAEMINLHLMEEAQRQSRNARSQRNHYEALDRSFYRNEYDESTLGDNTWWNLLNDTHVSFSENWDFLNLTNNTWCDTTAHPPSNNDTYNSANHAINNISHANSSTRANNSSSNSKIRTDGTSNSANNAACSNIKDVTCLICFESLFDRNKMATECGHLLCSNCMDLLITAGQNCPVCKHKVHQNRIFPVYF